MADVHFRVPYGLMRPHRYFGVPETQGKWAQGGGGGGGDLREIALQERIWSQYWASLMP